MIVPKDGDEPSSLHRLGRSILAESKASLIGFWSVFWKVSTATTALLLLLFFSMHYDELTGPIPQVAFGVIVVVGYCAFYAFWFGVAAGIFAALWRWCGAWILVPVIGAVLGAVAAVVLAFLALREIDFRGGGLHGGGDIAAFLVIGLLLVSAVIGAICGGVLSGVPALIIAVRRRRRRQANGENVELSET